MKKIFCILIVFVFLGCNSKSQVQDAISKKDSLLIENQLLALKNWSFIECYSLSEADTYKRLGKNLNEVRADVKDLTQYYYVNNSEIDLNYVYKDKNRERLVKKWVSKKEYLPFVDPPNFPDGSMNVVRALDFYNSPDLQHYIDSVRVVEIRKIKTPIARNCIPCS